MENKFSVSELMQNKTTGTPDIVIPEWIFRTCLNLCTLKIEYSGQLICNGKIAEYAFLTGSGTGASVFPNKKIIFPKLNGMRTIEFHTHPIELGDYYQANFSSGDYSTFDKRVVQEGDNYEHILFTKTNAITWAKTNPATLRLGFGAESNVIDIFEKWNNKHGGWTIPKI